MININTSLETFIYVTRMFLLMSNMELKYWTIKYQQLVPLKEALVY